MTQTRQQAREQILKLAKQGDPSTLAALLDRKLRAREIAVRVERKDERLSIILESEETPEQDRIVSLIGKAMKKLNAERIKTVEIWGCRRGQERPDWVQALTLDQTSLKQALSAWLESSIVLPSFQSNRKAIAPKPVGEEFLRFHLGAKDAALLPVSCIKEVLQVSASEILPVPHMSDRLLGVYNWRGEMLWLLDINRLLGFEPTATSDGSWSGNLDAKSGKASAIALSLDGQVLGLLVRRVDDIERHDLQELEPASAGLFAPQLLPFARGYLTEADAMVLDARAILLAAKQFGHTS